MTQHASLLRALLLASAVPAVGCGGKTDTTTSSVPGSTGGTSSGGSGGSNAGTNGGGSSSGGAAGSGVAGSTAGGAGGSGGAAQVPCVDPKPLLIGGKPTGYQTCASGAMTRPEVLDCPSLAPRPETCPGASPTSGCQKDSDCTEKANGYCGTITALGGEAPGCYCQYGCTKDADCGAGSVCLCGDPVGRCVPSTCTDDASCAEGGCAVYEQSPGCPFPSLACQLLVDECASDAECLAKSQQTPFCTIKEGKRVCAGYECAAGRPLRMEEQTRMAPLEHRGDW